MVPVRASSNRSLSPSWSGSTLQAAPQRRIKRNAELPRRHSSSSARRLIPRNSNVLIHREAYMDVGSKVVFTSSFLKTKVKWSRTQFALAVERLGETALNT